MGIEPGSTGPAAAERHQVWLYLTAIGAGLASGSAWPGAGEALAPAVWPTIGVLLYVTFTQVPLVGLGDALRDRRFVVRRAGRQFVVVPLVV